MAVSQIILSVVAFFIAVEGAIPFVSPIFCRRLMEKLMRMTNLQLRIFGLITMLIGLVIMVLVHFHII